MVPADHHPFQLRSRAGKRGEEPLRAVDEILRGVRRPDAKESSEVSEMGQLMLDSGMKCLEVSEQGQVVPGHWRAAVKPRNPGRC